MKTTRIQKLLDDEMRVMRRHKGPAPRFGLGGVAVDCGYWVRSTVSDQIRLLVLPPGTSKQGANRRGAVRTEYLVAMHTKGGDL